MRVGRCGGGQAGETQKRPFQLSFNSCLRVDFQGAAGNTVDQYRLKPCGERSSGLYGSWNRRVKKGTPA
jgi:hypothetical protein